MVVNTTKTGVDEHGKSEESEEYYKWKLTHSNKS